MDCTSPESYLQNCLVLVALPGAYATAGLPLLLSWARNPSLHEKALVLEEDSTYSRGRNGGAIPPLAHTPSQCNSESFTSTRNSAVSP
jgi:hypothetical protein